jgi:dTDP-4-dehydrorhamnose reductase
MSDKKQVIVLGIRGMLGHQVFKYLSCKPDIDVFGTTHWVDDINQNRNVFHLDAFHGQGQVPWYQFDYAINCIGIIKPHIKEEDPESITRAVRINAEFPQQLGNLYYDQCMKTKNIHASTDCVFSGDIHSKRSGIGYCECDNPDPTDVYGRTKLLGECPQSMNLRTSLIGPELHDPKQSLLEWYLRQPINTPVDGFVTHDWNGCTTLQWAKMVYQIICDDLWAPGTFHIGGEITNKAELLQLIRDVYDEYGVKTAEINIRHDVKAKDMILDTKKDLYTTLGIPSLREQIKVMAEEHVG